MVKQGSTSNHRQKDCGNGWVILSKKLTVMKRHWLPSKMKPWKLSLKICLRKSEVDWLWSFQWPDIGLILESNLHPKQFSKVQTKPADLYRWARATAQISQPALPWVVPVLLKRAWPVNGRWPCPSIFSHDPTLFFPWISVSLILAQSDSGIIARRMVEPFSTSFT